MINVALPASPAFHPSSLILSLLTLIRTLPLSALILLIPGVTPRVPWNFSAHLHTMIIEDLAGIRSKKAEERKCKARKKRKLHTGSTNAEEGIGDLQEGFGAFSPPTVGYTCDLLAMSCSKGGGGAKMVFSKLSLLSIMLAKTASTDSAWSKVCERWEKRIGDSLDVSSGVDVDERQEFEGMKSTVHELVGFISRSRMT